MANSTYSSIFSAGLGLLRRLLCSDWTACVRTGRLQWAGGACHYCKEVSVQYNVEVAASLVECLT